MAKRIRPDSPGALLLQSRDTKVKFALEKNVVYIREYDLEDLRNAWNSRAEAVLVKLAAQLTVESYKQGALDTANDCIRGLEVHADPFRTEAKILRSQNFICRIIQQQDFLRSIMGKVNDQILSKMSATLSAQDTRDAREAGNRDANAALYIHACDQGLCWQTPDGKSATNKMAEDVASSMKGDELVGLLKRGLINGL